MGAMTREELQAFRAQKQRAVRAQREADGRTTEVIIGTGTCGIAAGAEVALKAIEDEVAKHALANVVVKRTGCMGLCASEPSVEVVKPGMPGILYGKVDAAVGRRIVQEHIMNDQLVGEYIFDKPAADIMQ